MSDENFEIGRWGKERQKFMTENYLAETAELMEPIGGMSLHLK